MSDENARRVEYLNGQLARAKNQIEADWQIIHGYRCLPAPECDGYKDSCMWPRPEVRKLCDAALAQPQSRAEAIKAVIEAAGVFVAAEHEFQAASLRSGEGTVGGSLVQHWNNAKRSLVDAWARLTREGRGHEARD